MARNAVRIGCVPMISRAKSIMTETPHSDSVKLRLTDAAPRRAELLEDSVYQFRRRPLGIDMLVFETHRLPFERAELMERLDFYPFDVFHRRDKFGDPFDIGGIIRGARHEGEAHPRRLVHFRQPLGKAQGWSQIAPGYLAIGLRVRTFDVEQNKVEHREKGIVGTIAQKARRFDGRV